MALALIVEKESLDMIFIKRKRKTWELRKRDTTTRGPIGLIEKGTKTIVGKAMIVKVIALPPKKMERYEKLHRTPKRELREYGKGRKLLFAYVLKNPLRFRKPVPYRHRSGAVTWVRIPRLPRD